MLCSPYCFLGRTRYYLKFGLTKEPVEKGQYDHTYEEIFLAEAVRLSRDGLATRSIRMLENWRMRGTDVSFLIGGADGLAPACLARAEETLSLSALTFPHQLVRVMLAEQLYRAWTLTQGHPYHRE